MSWLGRLEEAYLAGTLPPKARQVWERLAWVLDVEPEELGEALARLGLPQGGWILEVARVGWQKGLTPPGAEVLAREGLVDPETRRLTKKGRAALELLEECYRYAQYAEAVGR
ncbi:hypothetical protein KZX47_10310 [Thermus sp. SYSU G05001]|uniref:Uncharacterized protein n=1 Tax=Thermus brevis TaxID=2862456 RepID=A0ABS6ZZQ6_9DEIN|nr:hypothetical protein [Thermus brevis]MBW6395541.1 hypothetical protein [Thermus brevis]